MKTFKDFTLEEQKQIVANDEQFAKRFEDFINDNEMHWINEKLEIIGDALSDWRIGAWSHSYITVDNYFRFVDCVEECKRNFGLSAKCEKLLEHCKRLYYSNLFEHYAKKLCDLFYNEEIKASLDWIENAGQNLYHHEITEEMEDSLESFYECGYLDGYTFEQNDDEVTIYEPQVKRTVKF